MCSDGGGGTGDISDSCGDIDGGCAGCVGGDDGAGGTLHMPLNLV